MIKLHLVDINPRLEKAWRKAFSDDHPEVRIHCADILKVASGTVVSPASSRGNMGGGIDRIYVDYFGRQLEKKVKSEINKRKNNMLPVGEAILIPTADAKIPYLISAPTMEIPGPVSPDNCYLAMAAVLKLADQHRSLCSNVFCPGLATRTGRVPPKVAAIQMESAYAEWKIAVLKKRND